MSFQRLIMGLINWSHLIVLRLSVYSSTITGKTKQTYKKNVNNSAVEPGYNYR